MFSNILTNKSPRLRYDKSEINNIYQQFHNLLNNTIVTCDKTTKEMLSSRTSTVASDDSFITPVSSMGDLMAMSPRKTRDLDQPDVTSDLLTGTDFDSICDVTMHEVPLYDDNMFIDANSLDYLVKCTESNRNHTMIDRGKESLFVKFDPLYAKQMLKSPESTHEVSHLESSECDIGYETGSSTSAVTDNIAVSPKHELFVESVLTKCAKDKPTQVVPPVLSNAIEFSKGTTSQTRTTPALLRSVSAILTPTQTTERLISISGNTPPIAAPRSPRQNRHTTNYVTQEVDRLQSLRIILQNQDQEVLQLRQENRELKSSLQDIQHNFSRTKEELENKVKKLVDERDNLLQQENKLIRQVNDKTLSHKQMCIVMEEYEKTISSLIGEQQKEKLYSQEIYDKLTSERDEALNHLTSMESSFNDLLAKYEKCKSIIMESRGREKILNNKISEYEAGMQKYESLYNNIKQVTSDNLDKANEELENIKKSHNVDITKLNATIKKHEIMISSLQESLAQKVRDNEELTRICDQLINEVHETDLLWCFNEKKVIDEFVTSCDSDHNEGYSSCAFDMSEAGRATFHGYLDTRIPKDGRIKKAGYCAIRSQRIRKAFKREATYDWNLYNTLVLKVRGDGRSYLLNISCEGYYDITWNDIYHYVLYTRGGPYWQIAKIPFSKFILGSKGRLQDKQTRMRLDKVTHFGISCGDKINGIFNLEIEYIGLEFDPTHDEEFAYEMYKTDRYIVGV